MRLSGLVVLATVFVLVSGAGVTYWVSGQDRHASGSESARLQGLLDDEQRVQWLVIHGSSGDINNLYLLSYEPLSDRFSAVYLSGTTRVLSSRLGGAHSLEEMARTLSPEHLRDDLVDALEVEIPFWVQTESEDLSYFVDLMGGVQLELIAPPRGDSPTRDPRRTVRWVDGSMAREYVRTAYEEYGEQGRRFRHKALFLGIVRWAQNHESVLEHQPFWERFHARVSTNMTPSDMKVAGKLLLALEEGDVKFPGPLRLRTVEGEQGILAPKQVESMLPRPLKRIIRESEPQEMIKVQVLNGAGLPNLAGVVRDFLQPKSGVDVVEVGNAERYTYETTRIIDRSNNPQSADRIRKMLGTGQIVSEPSDRLLVDVTVIAGDDLKRMIRTGS